MAWHDAKSYGKQVVELRGENQELRGENQELRGENRELREENQDLREENQELREKLEVSIRQCCQQAEEFRKTQATLLSEITKLRQELARHMETIAELQSENSELRKRLHATNHRLKIQKRARNILSSAYTNIFDKAYASANEPGTSDDGSTTQTRIDQFFKTLGNPSAATEKHAVRLSKMLVDRLTAIAADDSDATMSRDDRSAAVRELFDAAQGYGGGDPLTMASLLQQTLKRLVHDVSMTEALQTKLFKDAPWFQKAVDCFKVEEALTKFCSQLRRKQSFGALTEKQKEILFPLARSLLEEGLSWSKVSAITGLGWRAKAVVNGLGRNAHGDFTLPQRKRRSDARDGDADECRAWWLLNSRSEPGMSLKHSVVDPAHKRQKATKAPAAARSNIRWVRGTFLQLYKDYHADVLAKHAQVPNFVVPCYSFFMRNKPHTIRKEGTQTCLCTICLQIDLMGGCLNGLAKNHSVANRGCQCNKQAKRLETGRAARAASMCPRANTAHAMFNINCIHQNCEKCGVKTLFKVGSDECPIDPTPTTTTPAAGSGAAAPPVGDPSPNIPITLCPGLFRDPRVLRCEPGASGYHIAETDDCSKCGKPRPPRDDGLEFKDGKIRQDHCSCGCVTVPMLKKVNYTNSKGEIKKRDEFVDTEMTPDELWIRFNELMPEYILHLDKASVQDAQARQYSDDVPLHSIFTICDFAENGTFDPRAEWVLGGGPTVHSFPRRCQRQHWNYQRHFPFGGRQKENPRPSRRS